MTSDEIAQAVFARDEVAKYLAGSHGIRGEEARAKVEGYLDELRTTQRYPIYRALKHPLYPILRKIDRVQEHVEIAQQATAAGRVIYISNHKSHLDYLIEPLLLKHTDMIFAVLRKHTDAAGHGFVDRQPNSHRLAA